MYSAFAGGWTQTWRPRLRAIFIKHELVIMVMRGAAAQCRTTIRCLPSSGDFFLGCFRMRSGVGGCEEKTLGMVAGTALFHRPGMRSKKGDVQSWGA